MKKTILILIFSITLCLVSCLSDISNDTSSNVESFYEVSVRVSENLSVSEYSTMPEAESEETSGDFSFTEEIEESEPVIINVSAAQAFVYNLTEEHFVYEKNSTQNISPASVTKLLTALYAVKNVPVDTEITVGDELYLLNPYSSVAGIKIGEVYTLEQLLYGMLLPSGNDCAYTIAVNVAKYKYGENTLTSRDALELFMADLNGYAETLGCTDTNFTVPDGLAEREHYTSARDLTVIASAVLKNRILSSIISTSSYTFTAENGQQITYGNTNQFLHTESQYGDICVTGMKTGTLYGYSILVSVNYGSYTYIIGVFESDTHLNRYNDAQLLINAIKDGSLK